MSRCEKALCVRDGETWKDKVFCRGHLAAYLAEENARLENEISTYWRPHVQRLEMSLMKKTTELGATNAALHGASAWLRSIQPS